MALEVPANSMAPSVTAGTAPTRNVTTTRGLTSWRLHQIRARLPKSIVIVSTGIAVRAPRTKTRMGSSVMPAPKPATPPRTEPTSAPATSAAHPTASRPLTV